ncbi:MAG: VWA domain-containing protein [Corynebacterium sp.]|nr:VWA domain-containing protein [Corynebacterium sp.]
MGRHSTGTQNRKFSAGFISIIIAIILVIALVIWLFVRDTSADSTDTASECTSDSVALPVATTDPAIAADIVDNLNTEDIEVRDYCDIAASLTENVSEAGLLITSYSDEQIAAYLEAAHRQAATAADQWPTAAYTQLGVAGTADEAVLEDLTPISYPVASDPMGSALVAAYASDNNEAVAQDLLQANADNTLAQLADAGRLYATNKAAVPADAAAADKEESTDEATTVDDAVEGEATTEDQPADAAHDANGFVAIPGLYKQVRLIALQSGGNVDENTSRAAQALANYTSENAASTPEDSVTADYAGTAESVMPLNLDAIAAVAAAEAADNAAATNDDDQADDQAKASEEADTDATTAAPAAELSQNTLFLVDTSANMTGQWMDATRDVVAHAASEVAQAGGEIALWNYSSPLTGARTVGWRDNEAFGSSVEEISYRISILGTGGEPLTHEAVQAAVGEANAHNARIVLITSGSSDSSPVELQGVDLDIIHVGDPATADNALAEIARSTTNVSDPARLTAAMDETLGA